MTECDVQQHICRYYLDLRYRYMGHLH